MKFKDTTLRTYSKVSNRRVVQNSRGGWKKYQNEMTGGVGLVREVEKIESFNTQGVGERGF